MGERGATTRALSGESGVRQLWGLALLVLDVRLEELLLLLLVSLLDVEFAPPAANTNKTNNSINNLVAS